jgi:hypothetical protein
MVVRSAVFTRPRMRTTWTYIVMQDAGEAALWPELGHCVCGESSSREEVNSAVSGGDGMLVEQMLAGSIWPRCVVCGLCEQTRLDEL